MFIRDMVYIVLVVLVSLIEVYVSWRLGLFKEFGSDGKVPEWLLILLTFLILVGMQLLSPILFILSLTFIIIPFLVDTVSRLLDRRRPVGRRRRPAGRLNIQKPASTNRITYWRDNKHSSQKNTISSDVWKGDNDDITISIDFSKDEEGC